MTTAAIPFIWSGDAMIPMRGRAAECNRQYVIGERYVLEALPERSAKAHKRYFAEIRNCWASLPEALAERYSSPEALRKAALINTGWADKFEVAAARPAGARVVAEAMAHGDDYAVVHVSGCIATVWRAKSQAIRKMTGADFKASSDQVLNWIYDLLQVEPGNREMAA